MIISHSQKFIFVHIPKTAGTSITRYLDKYLSYQDLVVGSTKLGEIIQPYYQEKYKIGKHSPAKRIKKIMGNETWNEYFSFSLVRNPWDRMVSLYEWCCKRKFDLKICVEARKAGSFSSFLRSECFKEVDSQLHYLTNPKGDIIVDFVGKQESIQNDFEYICNKIEIPEVDMSIFKRNVSRSLYDYRKHYLTNEDIEIVGNQFSSEIKIFNYEF